MEGPEALFLFNLGELTVTSFMYKTGPVKPSIPALWLGGEKILVNLPTNWMLGHKIMKQFMKT
jgi:hypothetical protein